MPSRANHSSSACCVFIFGLIQAFAPCARAEQCLIRLGDVTAQTGITFRHTDGGSGERYIVETVAAGLALFDYDGDGDIDIYFLNGAPLQGDGGRRAARQRPLSQRRRLDVHRRDRRRGRGRHGIRAGRGRRRLRQRRRPGPLRQQLRPQRPLPQQRRRHVHRRDRGSRRRQRRQGRRRRLLPRHGRRRRSRPLRGQLRRIHLRHPRSRHRGRLPLVRRPQGLSARPRHPLPQQRRRHVHRRQRRVGHRRRRRHRAWGWSAATTTTTATPTSSSATTSAATSSSRTTAPASSKKWGCSPAWPTTFTATRMRSMGVDCGDYDNDGGSISS